MTTPGRNEPRRLATEVWYPAVEDARGRPGETHRIDDILSSHGHVVIAPDHAVTLWEESSDPKMELVLEIAGYFTFSDLCKLDPDVV